MDQLKSLLSMSHDLIVSHAIFKILVSGTIGSWYVSLGIWALQSLFKWWSYKGWYLGEINSCDFVSGERFRALRSSGLLQVLPLLTRATPRQPITNDKGTYFISFEVTCPLPSCPSGKHPRQPWPTNETPWGPLWAACRCFLDALDLKKIIML